jgi:hypothetical protein
MKTLARFYGFTGVLINLRGDDDLANGDVVRYEAGAETTLFTGSYVDAIAAFLNTCFSTAAPDLEGRINDLRASAVTDIAALQAAAEAAASQAVAEVQELAADVTQIVETARAVQ